MLAKFSFDTAENEPRKVCPLSAYRSSSHFHLFSLSRLCVLYVETLTGVLFWSFDLLGNIFEQLVFHLRPSPDHYCCIDCALGSATGVYHVSKFNSSVRTISSPDITRFSSSSISCTSENDFSGFGTCAQHGNIGSQAVRAEPALLEKRIFSTPSPPYGSTSKGFPTPQLVNTPQ